jgi:hypothetical protein
MITVPNYGYTPHAVSHSDASYISEKTVSDLYKQMKDQNHQPPTRSVSSAANLTSLCVDISPSSSNFFEVLYIGKIKVWQKKVPESFIDDALEKFKAHEMEKTRAKMLGNIGRLKSEDNIRRGSMVIEMGLDRSSAGLERFVLQDSTSSVESLHYPHLQRSTTIPLGVPRVGRLKTM